MAKGRNTSDRPTQEELYDKNDENRHNYSRIYFIFGTSFTSLSYSSVRSTLSDITPFFPPIAHQARWNVEESDRHRRTCVNLPFKEGKGGRHDLKNDHNKGPHFTLQDVPKEMQLSTQHICRWPSNESMPGASKSPDNRFLIRAAVKRRSDEDDP
ncbi:uncharacterized protein LOC106668664 [Cimex lectularius]|uniref:Uncharacterized protein n=1 Tax=Cimex lectularius TaxID=79782 RepID=A0A8I6RVC3_CIMLE|nr:uncharacterized protein LOC106668664 [Cimex lectularius]